MKPSGERNLANDLSSREKTPCSKAEMFFQSPSKPGRSCDGNSVSQESSLSEHESSGSSGKRKERKWDKQAEESDAHLANNDAVKRRKTRWSSDDSQLKRLGPLKLPELERNDKTQQDLELEELNRQLVDLNNKLMRPDVMDNLGCIRAELIKQKQKIVSKLVNKTLGLKSQSGSKHATLYKKLYIPEKQYPDYNFVGLIKGPRGAAVRRMEAETGAKIFIRGKRSDKEIKHIRPGKQTKISKNDDLHVRIEATNQKSLDAAVEMVEKLLVPVEDCENDRKQKQLFELAVLNGKAASCDICGDVSHSTQLCPLIASAPHTEQQVDPLSGLGAGMFKFGEPVPSNVHPQTETSAGTNKGTDETFLTVGCLPISIDEIHLKQLFHPFGNISSVKLVRDPTTGVSKGCGFVKFSDPACAAIAIEKMHGFRIRKMAMTVRIADCPPTTPGSSDLTCAAYPGSLANPQSTSTPTAWPTFPKHSGSTTPAVPSFRPPIPTNDHPASKEKGTDDSNLFVGHLPGSIDEGSLKPLFDPFGTVSSVKVVRDPVTGVSKGCAFVKYNDPASAATAIKVMHGFQIGNKTLAVRVAHRPATTPSSSALPTAAYPGSGANPEATPTPTSWPALPQHSGYTSPTVPSILPTVSNDDNRGIGVSSGTSNEKGTDESNLFVGHLPGSVDEGSLKPLFDPFGTISSVNVVRDPVTGVSKGCAFVKYNDPASAATAIKVMHGFQIGNKTLAVRIAHRPPTSPCSSALPTAAYPGSSANPQATLTPSAWPGFPQHSGYTTPAVPSLLLTVSSDVYPGIGCSSGTSKAKGIDEANLYVGCLPVAIDEASLKPLFDPFGTISSLSVVRDPSTGVSKGYGFIKYSDSASAAIAIRVMHGSQIGNKTVIVRVAHRPSTTACSSALPTAAYPSSPANPQATSIPTALPQNSAFTTPTVHSFHPPVPSDVHPSIGASSGTSKEKGTDEANLFVGNLPHSVNEVSLKPLFDPFGTITSLDVVRDPVTGVSKGCGFVKYSDPASAAIAIEKMHGFKIGNKDLAVRVAHRPRTTLDSSALPTAPYPGSSANPQAISTPAALPALPQHSGYTTPTVPSFHPPVPSDVHFGIGPLCGTSKEKGIDESNLFVGSLPHYMDEASLKPLFDPFGTVSSVSVLRDPVTGLSKGCGFVKYSDPASAATAIEKMHDFRIGKWTLAVRVAHHPPTTLCNSALPTEASPGSPANPQAMSTPTAWPALPQHSGYTTAPSFHPPVPSHVHPGIGALSGTSKENATDEANLSVLNLPEYIDEVSLKRLFDPYGTISGVKVVRDPVTSLSKGYGFVRYRDPASAAIAIENIHGLELGDNTLAVRIASRPSATPGSSASAPGYPRSPANQVALKPTVLSALPQYTGYFTPTVPSFHPSVPGCLIPAAHVLPTSHPSVLGPSPPSEQPVPLAADNSTFYGHSGLLASTKPMPSAFNRPTCPAFNGPTPPAQAMTTAVHSLHPGHSLLTTPGRPTVPVPPAVPGYSPSSSAQTTSFVDRTASDAGNWFPSTTFTSSSLSGKLPESIDVKDFQRRPVHLPQASASRFSSPVTTNVTRSAPGTESFPGDPDTFRSRLL